MCEKNQYTLPDDTRKKLIAAFQHLVDHKDEHFGNGRLTRNIFEKAIRRQASRIVNLAPITRDMLTTLRPEDVEIKTRAEECVLVTQDG